MVRHPRTDRAGTDVRWFWGIDGQVIIDDEYVWIAREGLTHAGADHRRQPRRARMADVTGLRGADVDGGTMVLLQILVNGADPDDIASPSPTDAVLFRRDEVERIIEELIEHEHSAVLQILYTERETRQPESRTVWPPRRLERALRLALGAREAIATREELVQAIVSSEHITDPSARADLERTLDPVCQA